jgi:hypothetical protein
LDLPDGLEQESVWSLDRPVKHRYDSAKVYLPPLWEVKNKGAPRWL